MSNKCKDCGAHKDDPEQNYCECGQEQCSECGTDLKRYEEGMCQECARKLK